MPAVIPEGTAKTFLPVPLAPAAEFPMRVAPIILDPPDHMQAKTAPMQLVTTALMDMADPVVLVPMDNTVPTTHTATALPETTTLKQEARAVRVPATWVVE